MLFFLLLQVVKDPLFELAITLCIVLNTMFLALEHHGMSESVRQALDIGNKVCLEYILHYTIYYSLDVHPVLGHPSHDKLIVVHRFRRCSHRFSRSSAF